MKTLASFLLISAVFVTAIAYAQESSSERAYSPATNNISALSHAQVVAELEAARAVGRFILGESEEPTLSTADSRLNDKQALAEATATHASGSYMVDEFDYKAAFSVRTASRS